MATASSSRLRRAIYPLMIVAAVVVPMLVTASMGGLSIPRNDDWLYQFDAFRLHNTGHLRLMAWTSTMIVGQIFWAQPFLTMFGEHSWVLKTSAALLELFGLCAAWDLTSHAIGRNRALLAIAILVFGPAFLNIATSFMSDGPALWLQFISLALAFRSIRSGQLRFGWFVASMVAAVAAFSVRELAIAVLPAVVFAVVYVTRDYKRTVPCFVGALASCAFMYVWRTHLGSYSSNQLHLPVLASEMNVFYGSFTVGLGVLPAVVWRIVNRQLWGKSLFWSFALAAMMLSLFEGTAPFIGNLWTSRGATEDMVLSGERPVLVPSVLWSVLTDLGAVSIACAIVIFLTSAWKFFKRQAMPAAPADEASRGRAILFSFAMCSIVMMIVFTLVSRLFDRYALSCVFATATMLLLTSSTERRTSSRVAILISLLIPAALSTTILLNSNSYDLARWNAAQHLVDSGVPATSIDAGIEWVGLHSGDGAGTGEKLTPYTVEPDDVGRRAWITAFAVDYQCFVVTNSELNPNRYKTIAVIHYDLYGFWGSRRMFVQARIDDPCRQRFADRPVA